MKRLSKFLLAAAGIVGVLTGALVWIFLTGSMPLEDGVELAEGNVIVVADRSVGPIPAAAYLFRLRSGDFGLIDSTMDPEARAIRAALARVGKKSDAIIAIFFTHDHGDHTAGALAFPNADVYLGESVDLSQGARPAESLWHRFQRRLNSQQQPSGEKHTIARRLSDGGQMEVGGTTVEVFAVPGHTADSAAFLMHGVLFLGDSAAAASDGSITAAPPIFSVDRDRNMRELKKLADRLRSRRGEIRHLAFGHQGPLEGIDPLLEWAAASE